VGDDEVSFGDHLVEFPVHVGQRLAEPQGGRVERARPALASSGGLIIRFSVNSVGVEDRLEVTEVPVRKGVENPVTD
jgi:hypothetical protein